MARSEQEIAKAIAESDAWMDAVEPARLSTDAVNDRKDLRQIGVAMLAIEAAEQSLVAAVAQARARGRSWTDIANVLGVSRQAARQRFDVHTRDVQMKGASCLGGAVYFATNSDRGPGAYGSYPDYWNELGKWVQLRMSECPPDSRTEWIACLVPVDHDDRYATDAPSQFDESSRSG